MNLSSLSIERLKGVHPRLAVIVTEASDDCGVRFLVAEGVRTVERQKQLLTEGRTKTLNSKHLIQPDGFGYAVDIIPIVDGLNIWGYLNKNKLSRLDIKCKISFREIERAMRGAAEKHGVELRWGNDWDGDGVEVGPDPDESFEDWPHWEIKSVKYE